MKMLNKPFGPLSMSAFFLLGLSLCQGAANAASYVVSNVNGSGAGSLRAAIASANSDGVDSDIAFDATAFASLKTILLGGSELGLNNNGKLSITGPTAGVEISGNATNRVFSVGAGADVTLSKVSIIRGKSDRGAGINNAGTLTVNTCIISINQASEYGGGIYNTGNLTVKDSTITGNTATSQYGGGIQNGNDLGSINAVLTATGSLFRNNKAKFGGGLANQYASTATVTNCTFYNNVADERGAGVDNGGSTNLTNCTFVVNTNLSAKPGAGVYAFPGYYVGLTNCLAAQNAPDNFGQYVSDNGGNVQASTVQEAGLNATGLANNGGPTETVALVSRGTGVNAGVNGPISGFPNDQRGSSYSRIIGGSVDSGAYESSFTPTLVNNNGLTVAPGGTATITEEMLKATDAVTNPLTFSITTGPTHGTVRLGGNPTNSFTQDDIAAGNVSYTQDGSLAGSDSFVFNAGGGRTGYVTGTFEITIPETRSLVVTTTADTEANDGQISLREAINFSNEDGVDSAITFDATVFAAPRKTITLRGEPLTVIFGNGTTSVTAPAAGIFINGNNVSGVFETGSDAFVTFKGLTISGGNAEQGGGIKNSATLLVDSCTLSGNRASFGGAIYSENNGTGGSLTIRNSTLSGNFASEGGGLYNSVGSTFIENSTITGNTAPDNYGAGIVCPGDMFTPVEVTVRNSIIAGNVGTDVDYVFGNINSDNILSGGYNLLGDGSATDFFYENGDIVGNTNPGLAPLTENGGPTPTHALLTGSPAFNAGNPGFNGAGQFDQRGNGFPRVQNGPLDIGAFEVPNETVLPSISLNAPTVNQSVSVSTFAGLSGTAADNVGVTQVLVRLLRIRNGITTYWNGSSFISTNTALQATVASPGASATAWSYPVSPALKAAMDGGAYQAFAYARDAAGNQTATPVRPFSVDNSSPVPVVSAPTAGQILSLAGFTGITGSATDNIGVTQVLLRLERTRNGVTTYWNGASFGANAAFSATVTSPGAVNTTWTYPASSALKSAMDSGNYVIYAYGRDAAGNQAVSGTRTFSIDNSFPVPGITAPTANQTVSLASFSSINGSATDNIGVTQVLLRLERTRNGVTTYWNGTSFGSNAAFSATVTSPGATGTTWNYPASSALKAAMDVGSYVVYAYGRDAVGNQSPPATRSFTLSGDSTAPVSTITSPTVNQSLSLSAFSGITGGATDNVGVAQVLLRLERTRNGVTTYWNGTSFGANAAFQAAVASPGATNTTWSYPASSALKAAMDNGTYVVYAYGRDSASNQSVPATRSFTLSGAAAPIQAPSSSATASGASS